jgi:hypothetical protein
MKPKRIEFYWNAFLLRKALMISEKGKDGNKT